MHVHVIYLNLKCMNCAEIIARSQKCKLLPFEPYCINFFKSVTYILYIVRLNMNILGSMHLNLKLTIRDCFQYSVKFTAKIHLMMLVYLHVCTGKLNC